MRPYYQDDLVTIFHGDWRDDLDVVSWATLPGAPTVLVTDPPYGIDYESGREGVLERSIANNDCSERDALLAAWGDRPALVFGSWRRPSPVGTRMALVWDKGPALGMGALDLTMRRQVQ